MGWIRDSKASALKRLWDGVLARIKAQPNQIGETELYSATVVETELRIIPAAVDTSARRHEVDGLDASSREWANAVSLVIHVKQRSAAVGVRGHPLFHRNVRRGGGAEVRNCRH